MQLMRPPRDLIQSLDSGLQALLLLLDRDRVSASDVARELGVARSTAHRLLATLEYRGLVGRSSESGGYTAGPILSDLSMPYGLDPNTRRWLAPVLDDALARTGTNVYTAVLMGSTSLLMDGRIPPNPPAPNLAGLTRPAYSNSSGMMLLSRLSRRQVEQFYPNERLFKTATDRSATREAFFEELEIVRRRGYATSVTSMFGDGVAILLTGRTWRDGIALQAVLAKGLGTPAELERVAGLLNESASLLSPRHI